MRALALLCALPVLLLSAGRLQAQAETPGLDSFLQHVVRIWSAGDVPALLELLPTDNRLLLDTGSGVETANARHAAAALRALFAEGETVGVRAVRATVASTTPMRGFGEMAWSFRPRGAPAEHARSVYIAILWEERAWRISELRIMP